MGIKTNDNYKKCEHLESQFSSPGGIFSLVKWAVEKMEQHVTKTTKNCQRVKINLYVCQQIGRKATYDRFGASVAKKIESHINWGSLLCLLPKDQELVLP